MKKLTYLLFTAILFSSCGGEGNNGEESTSDSTATENNNAIDINDLDMSEMQDIDLSEYEIPVTMKMPRDKETEVEIIHEEGDFLWDIRIGEKYHLEVELVTGMENVMADEKNRIKEFYNGNVEYLVDTDNKIMYKALLPSVDMVEFEKLKKSEKAENYFHHVYTIINVEGDDYVFRTSGSVQLSGSRGKDMLKAVKSITAK